MRKSFSHDNRNFVTKASKLNLNESLKLLTMVSRSFCQLYLLGRFLLLQHTSHNVSGLPVSVLGWSTLPENANNFRSGVVCFDSVKVPNKHIDKLNQSILQTYVITIRVKLFCFTILFSKLIRRPPPDLCIVHHTLPTVIMPCEEYKLLTFSLFHFVVLPVT